MDSFDILGASPTERGRLGMRKNIFGVATYIAMLASRSAAQTNTFPTPSGNVGIGTTSLAGHSLAFQGGTMHKRTHLISICLALMAGSAAAQYPLSGSPSSGQGPYMNWNTLTGTTGETDFINNSGTGLGGFAFMNTPNSGSPQTTLMFIKGTGNVGIGTTVPASSLQVGTMPNNAYGAMSSTIATYAATTLGLTTGSDITAASFGFGSNNNAPTNNVALGVHGYRVSAGSDWTTTAVGLSMDVDNVVRAGASLWLNSNGNIGIGTTAPGAKLEVNGNIKLTAASGASITFPDNTIQSTAWNGTLYGGDYAESVDVSGDRTRYEPGDVLVVDPEEDGKFLKAAEPYSKLVAGIYSTKPGIVGRRQTADSTPAATEVPMAMVGIVPTKVSAENGPIRRGDLLVASSTPGYAMKGTDFALLTGAVIEKALSTLAFGTGVIEVLVSLQ
jgi:hypothetical protein